MFVDLTKKEKRKMASKKSSSKKTVAYPKQKPVKKGSKKK
jgi:hypothetical protein